MKNIIKTLVALTGLLASTGSAQDSTEQGIKELERLVEYHQMKIEKTWEMNPLEAMAYIKQDPTQTEPYSKKDGEFFDIKYSNITSDSVSVNVHLKSGEEGKYWQSYFFRIPRE